MSESGKAVFLSYASQDAAAARKICDALRAAGVEVWFDQSELRGGDAWDQKIKQQIKECALFVPVISAHTEARGEGYFRLEWKLAADRSHLMARDQAFFFPVAIDDTPGDAARVPEEFMAVQWTRLPAGETGPEFCARVQHLLAGGRRDAGATRMAAGGKSPGRQSAGEPPTRFAGGGRLAVLGAALLAGALAIWQPWRSAPPKLAVPPVGAAAEPAPTPAVANPEVRRLVRQGQELLEQYYVDDTLRESLTLAERLAKQATQLDVADGEAWALSSLVSSSYYVTGRDRSSARRAAMTTEAERATKLAPNSDEAKFALAAAYRLQPTLAAQSEQMMRELVERHPTEKRFLRMLGNVLRNRKAYAEAIAAHARAAALPGGDARAWLAEAEILKLQGKRAEAGAAADRSLAVQPTGSAYLFKVLLATGARDFAQARTELARVPPAVLLDDRGAAVAAVVWLWSHEPEKAIAAINVYPGDELNNNFAAGPKSMILGFAHQLAGREEAARVQWGLALKALEQKGTADPALQTEPFFIGMKMFLGCLAGDPQKRAEASQMLRLVLQFGGMAEMPSEWEPVAFFTLMGRQDILLDVFEIALKSGDMPGLRNDLRTLPLYDPLRTNPRFMALLKVPEEKK